MIKTITTCLFSALLPFAVLAQGTPAEEDMVALNQMDAPVADEAVTLDNATSAFYTPQEVPPPAIPGGIYKLNWKVDIPVTAVGAGWSAYAFTKIYSKDQTPIEEIQALNKDDINGFDRWAAGMSDTKADDVSDLLFYGSIPLPAFLMADKAIRKDAAKIGFLYLEAMSVTGLLYTGSTYFTNRFRPEAYNTDIPAADRLNGGLRNAFFAGHVALVGTATFFTAKVYHDYHPGSTLSYVLWGGAIAATGATIYLRHAAGKHFPTDLIVGTAVGTLSGILVPHLHKNKVLGNSAFRVSPFVGNNTYGLTMNYKIK